MAQAMRLINASLLPGNKERRAVLLHRVFDFLSSSRIVLCFRLCSVQGVVALLHVFPDDRVSVVKNKQKQIQARGAMRAMPRDGLGVS